MDHYSVGEEYPDCLFLNPQRKDCGYFFKELAGCGVAFKLAQGLQRISGLEKKSLNSLLELVAIGTLADVMPVMDENRTLIKYGLKKIINNPSSVMTNILHNFALTSDRAFVQFGHALGVCQGAQSGQPGAGRARDRRHRGQQPE